MTDTTTAPLVQHADAFAAIDTLKRYVGQDPNANRQRIEDMLIAASLAKPPQAVFRHEPGALAKALPDDLSTLTLVQTTIHDNWGQATKPRGRFNAAGKRARETPTRYAVSLSAWDRPEADINAAMNDWDYHLVGDLMTASEFRAKALDLMNRVEDKDGNIVPKTRKPVLHPISEAAGFAMIALSLEHKDPATRFACLWNKNAKGGTVVAPFQFVRLKIGYGADGPVISDAALVVQDRALGLPPFDIEQSSGRPFAKASKAIAQSRYVNPTTSRFDRWRTK